MRRCLTLPCSSINALLRDVEGWAGAWELPWSYSALFLPPTGLQDHGVCGGGIELDQIIF